MTEIVKLCLQLDFVLYRAGDSGYEVSQLSSGSVTASTLTVLRRVNGAHDDTIIIITIIIIINRFV